MSNSENTCFKVVVWGPPDSGKESLAKELVNSLERYQETYPAGLGLIFYIQKVSDEEKKELNFPSTPQTAFYRLGRKRSNNKNADSRVDVSAFEHFLEINFHSAGTERQEVCRNADMLILALDPMQLKDVNHAVTLVDPVDDQEEIDLGEFVRQSIFFRNVQGLLDKEAHPEPGGKLSRAEYAGKVSKLGILSTENWYVEICITNIDKLPVPDRQLDSIELLNKYFGDSMKISLHNIKGKKIYFSFPTHNNITEQGIDLGRPLLQLLQADEIEHLSYQQSMFKRMLFGNENRKQYIPYFEDIRS